MQLTQAQRSVVTFAAKARGVIPAFMLAVVMTESAGKVSSQVGVRQEPLIRWEGHYFFKLLPASKRKAAVAAGLASPKAGAIKNPSSQVERYRLLERAKQIDEDAALMSCSWGIGQVMGSHWEALGYASVQEFVETARKGFDGQLELMLRFIEKNGLLDELQRQDASGFARGYNGPNYKVNAYDKKIMQAYYELSKGDMLVSDVSGMLRLGSSGKAVREVQAALNRTGATLKIDGDFGPSTRDAVKVFQKAKGLKVDGVVGPATMKLILAVPQPESDPGHLAAVDNKGVRNGAASAFAGLSAAASADKITGIADKLTGTGIALVDYATLALYGLSAALVIGGLGYGLYAHFKANRTEYGAS